MSEAEDARSRRVRGRMTFQDVTADDRQPPETPKNVNADVPTVLNGRARSWGTDELPRLHNPIA